MHPAPRRYSSVEYSRVAPSSRLAGQASRRSRCEAGLSPRAVRPTGLPPRVERRRNKRPSTADGLRERRGSRRESPPPVGLHQQPKRVGVRCAGRPEKRTHPVDDGRHARASQGRREFRTLRGGSIDVEADQPMEWNGSAAQTSEQHAVLADVAGLDDGAPGRALGVLPGQAAGNRHVATLVGALVGRRGGIKIWLLHAGVQLVRSGGRCNMRQGWRSHGATTWPAPDAG